MRKTFAHFIPSTQTDLMDNYLYCHERRMDIYFPSLLIRAGTSVCPRSQCQVIHSDVVVAVGEDEMYFPGHKGQQWKMYF